MYSVIMLKTKVTKQFLDTKGTRLPPDLQLLERLLPNTDGPVKTSVHLLGQFIKKVIKEVNHIKDTYGPYILFLIQNGKKKGHMTSSVTKSSHRCSDGGFLPGQVTAAVTSQACSFLSKGQSLPEGGLSRGYTSKITCL